MKRSTFRCGLVTAAVFGCSSLATAGVDDGFIYVNSTPSELTALGFYDVTAGTPISVVPSWCAGCYTGGEVPTTELKGFIEIDVTYNPADAAYGMYVYMDITYNDPNFQLEDFAEFIEASDPEIDVMTASEAGTPWCPFTDWGIPGDYTVFQWMPSEFDPSSTNPFETADLTFGWNFSGSALFGDLFPGIEIGLVGVVPSPGAIALLALTGIAARRRRRS